MRAMGRLLACVALAAWSTSCASAGGTATVVMRDMAFHPPEITVRVGDTVRWENHERRQFHNIWFKELGEDPGDYLFPDEHTERVFDRPGVFPYVCQPHERRGMTGVVTVLE